MQGLLCCLIGFWLLCKYFAWEILEIEGLVILCCFFWSSSLFALFFSGI